MIDSKIIKDIAAAIKNEGSGPAPYDTTAEVVRVEDGKAWVHIPGGVDETPADLTINAKKGDSVQVRVSGGRAFLVGNGTAPPTDDTAALAAQNAANIAFDAADQAVKSASIAAEAASQAMSDAAEAKTAAGVATTSANTALNQLSIVEDVVGTLNWISEHGTYALSSDTEVIPGKLYFTRSGSGTEADPYVYNVVVDPSGSPAQNGYYELDSVDEAVSNYVSTHLALTDAGLYVTSDANGWRVLIKSNGVDILDPAGNVVSNFGSSVTIGRDDGTESHQFLDYHSLQLINKEGQTYFHVSDLRDRSGRYFVAESAVIGSSHPSLTITNVGAGMYITELVSATVDGVEHIQDTTMPDHYTVTFNFYIPIGTPVEIQYYTDTTYSMAYTLGYRATNSRIGGLSVAEGLNIYAGGFAAHAEGVRTQAEKPYSHAEGAYTKARSNTAHAEGYYSIASGGYSHAEGAESKATASYSHAQNQSTIAANYAQTAIGRFNTDTSNEAGYGTYPLLIGNGMSDADRSNALAVKWDGDVEIALDVNAAASTVDGELYDAIDAMGWTSDVIV